MLTLGWRVLLGSALVAAPFLAIFLSLVDAPVRGSRAALAIAQVSLRATAIVPTPLLGGASAEASELARQLTREGDDLSARGELASAIYRYSLAAE
jgi:hypothetical protein